MVLFKIFWVIDAIAALIIFYFFFIGISDGTVSGRNMGLWIMITGGTAAILLGSIWLKNHQYSGMATGLLLILALPALFYLLYILIALLGGGRWN